MTLPRAKTFNLIMTYLLIIVYVTIKSIKLASVVFLEMQRNDLPSTSDFDLDLKCRNQCLVCGIPLKMPHLSLKFNEVGFGTF